jgi:hypothetical protein
MIPVVWLVSHPECWDQALIDDLLSARSWPVGHDFDHSVGLDALQGLDGAVVVIPGANQVGNAAAISDALGRLSWALVLLTSDEERRYPLATLDQHPHVEVWLQYPTEGDEADWYLPVGYPPHCRDDLEDLRYGKPTRWFWAGQVNHKRRRVLAETLDTMVDGFAVETAGFTQGLDHATYAAAMAQSQFAPCPSGPYSVDSFRVAEALEAVSLPIVDSRTPLVDGRDLWRRAYPGAPLPVVDDWTTLPAVLDELADDWPRNAARAGAWWLDYKRQLAERLGDAVSALSRIETQPDPMTVLIPTSPIASHPSVDIIETTIESVRFWHPEAPILVMCDGIRPEQDHYRDRYEAYLERLVWLAGRDGRTSVTIHAEHLHQAEMTRRALDSVRTPLILFVEHDTPLVTDEHIDWLGLFHVMLSGHADLIRFHYEAAVHPEHKHMMLDTEPLDILGVPLLRTVQWSQRPHLANTAFYRRIIGQNVPPGDKAMIEDVMHGRVHNDWRDYGLAGWDRYQMWMYAPDGNIKRSLHLDGRGTDPKWEFG